jgi:outer membrane protein assembly factor BamC
MPENLRPSRPSWRWLVTAGVVLALAAAIAGCGSATVQEMLPDQTLAYKKSREASENLELPPNLRAGSFDDALDVPSLDGGGATYSDYASGRAKRQDTVSSGEVLPAVANVEMRRSGSERWLEIQGSPQQVWPRVIAFWRQQGVLLVEQDPAVGVMKTDWLDNRAEIPQDFITRQLRKVVDGLYATSTRDQFRVQVEAGPRAGTTEVRLTHKGMEEKLVTNTLGDGSRTVWEPSGTDPGKEAEMLRRLMLFLGASEQQAKQALAGSPKGQGAASAAPASPARVVTEGGSQVLIIADEYRRGWRMVGSALDRAGFSVEDRDMTRGAYYVRYQDTDARAGAQKPSLGSRLAFWRKDDIDRVKQYQIRVEGGETQTRVTVLDAKGNPDGSASAGRILALLAEQMN